MTDAPDITELIVDEEEETFEFEDESFENSEAFRTAVRNAQNGQFEHTLFEVWENILADMIKGAEMDLTIPVADGLLRQWPWLGYHNLQGYLKWRTVYLKQAVATLQHCYSKPSEELFAENENDWELHKDTYIDVIVEWTRLTNGWTDKWQATALNAPAKPILHAVISDLAALLINPQNGLIEHIRNLAGFDLTEEEGRELTLRVAGETDD